MDALGDSFFPVTGSGKENPNDNMDIYDRADFISHMVVCSDFNGKEKADALAGGCRGCGMAGKLTIEQAIRWFRDFFRTENNILMELTLDDWVWLKSHRTQDGLFSAAHDE